MIDPTHRAGSALRATYRSVDNQMDAERPPTRATGVLGTPMAHRMTPRSDASSLHMALAAGMDRLSHGVALFDVDGRARYANAAARALLGRVGWSRDEAGLPSAPPDWTPALRRVCQQGRRELQRLAVKDAPMLVVLAPLSVPGQEFAFAVFGREELCGSVELQMFALRYQLTNAETLVLRHLTRGLTAAAIASEHGVACTTISTQIAAIRAKTRCNSVRSLLEMLARMPSMRSLQPIAE